jgi:hypothetical protein
LAHSEYAVMTRNRVAATHGIPARKTNFLQLIARFSYIEAAASSASWRSGCIHPSSIRAEAMWPALARVFT